jgi:hypothetical protein
MNMPRLSVALLAALTFLPTANAAEDQENWTCRVTSGGSGTVTLRITRGSLEVRTGRVVMGDYYDVISDTGLILIATGDIISGVPTKWTLDRGMGTLRVAIGQSNPQIREARCTRQG